jgi:hypothetical protein
MLPGARGSGWWTPPWPHEPHRSAVEDWREAGPKTLNAGFRTNHLLCSLLSSIEIACGVSHIVLVVSVERVMAECVCNPAQWQLLGPYCAEYSNFHSNVPSTDSVVICLQRMRYDSLVVACAVPGCTVTSRVPFHVVSVYSVADANSSLWDRVWVVPICLW